MSSAYGTQEGGSNERRPVVGGLYCAGGGVDSGLDNGVWLIVLLTAAEDLKDG
jgi:hypothetical protein